MFFNILINMDSIHLYLISACLGIILFFAILLAPTVFKVLDNKSVSLYLRAFFPKFYLSLFFLSGLAAFFSPNSNVIFLLLIVSILFLLSRWPLTGAINNATDQKNQKKFKSLHFLSVAIIFIQMTIMTSIFFLS